MIAVLASDGARFANGVILSIDGALGAPNGPPNFLALFAFALIVRPRCRRHSAFSCSWQLALSALGAIAYCRAGHDLEAVVHKEGGSATPKACDPATAKRSEDYHGRSSDVSPSKDASDRKLAVIWTPYRA